MSKTPVGEALHAHGEAVDHVEALYLQHEGEVTTEVEQAEAERDLAGRDALEAVGRYLLWIDDQKTAVTRELERLARVMERHAKRGLWAAQKAQDLAEAVAPGRTKVLAGTLTVRVKRTEAVVADPGLDPSTLPAEWQRVVDAVPARPATVALDRKAVKASRELHHPMVQVVQRVHVTVV